MLRNFLINSVLLFLIGCASDVIVDQDTNNSQGNLPTQKSSADDEFDLAEPDPLELFNRYMYGFNRVADAVILKHVAIAYDLGVPDNAKYCVESFLSNLCAPINTINYTLQGRGSEAAVTVCRFLLNTTFGLFGLLDFASFVGIEEKQTSFNETLATWGVEPGPYIMLPLLGPTTFRGMFGYGFDWGADPVRIVANRRNGSFNKHKRMSNYLWYIYGTDVVVKRSKLLTTLDDIDETSLDPYVTIRNIIFQRQASVDKRTKSRG